MTLPVAKGLLLTGAFYWDLTDATRAWSRRFAARNGGRYPTMNQAGTYASMLHWMKAITAMDKDRARSGAAAVAMMKEMPASDPLFGNSTIRPDGRTLHDMYLFQVKAPEESRGAWDYYKLLGTIPAAEAFRPLSASACALLRPADRQRP
jgi:branched-chain amino acid transport system substrate-binding protein